ncbi:hypothetical protein PHISP_05008 [Aspergillus sp. HF37]|nr:hypothetical protein PHISP_05008 [Aspergillus sp. HF37]
MVKVSLDSLLPLVPRVLHQQLRLSRYATQRSQSLVIQSDDARNRHTNVESCFEKFYQLLKTTADEAIPGETSPEQKDRVSKLHKAANEARIKSKKLHSSKKSSRRGSKYDD